MPVGGHGLLCFAGRGAVQRQLQGVERHRNPDLPKSRVCNSDDDGGFVESVIVVSRPTSPRRASRRVSSDMPAAPTAQTPGEKQI